VKFRIPARVADHLLASQAAYTPADDPEMAAILARLRGSKARKDGATFIDVTDPEELETLRIYVDAMAAGAADNTHDPDGVADLNSARAVLRALDRMETK
jgi:hypothetical protein